MEHAPGSAGASLVGATRALVQNFLPALLAPMNFMRLFNGEPCSRLLAPRVRKSGGGLQEKHFQERASTQRSLHYAPPNFLSRVVALMICMGLSLPRAAHVVVSSSAK